MNSIIKDFMEHSPILSPNENKQLLLKWAIEVYRKTKEEGSLNDKSDKRSLEINRRSNNDETRGDYTEDDYTALDFENIIYRTNEHSISKWDLTYAELKPFYDTARLTRDYECTYQVLCFPKKKKRRLPWLYPDTGILTFLTDNFA